MIILKCFDSFFEHRLLFLREERGADTHALFVRTHCVEREHSDAVIHQFAGQLKVVHTWILYREVEAVSQWRTKIVVVHKVETVIQEHV